MRGGGSSATKIRVGTAIQRGKKGWGLRREKKRELSKGVPATEINSPHILPKVKRSS